MGSPPLMICRSQQILKILKILKILNTLVLRHALQTRHDAHYRGTQPIGPTPHQSLCGVSAGAGKVPRQTGIQHTGQVALNLLAQRV